jgi:hypothetical protein
MTRGPARFSALAERHAESVWLRIAGAELRLVFAEGAPRAELLDCLTAASALPPSSSSTAAPGFEIHVSCGGAPPSTDTARFLSRAGDHCVLGKERNAPRGFVWYDDATSVRAWERAQPFRLLFAWWAEERGAALVHAGAVAGPRGAALIVGAPGAGKSTLAAACLAHGLEFPGDDYVWVDGATSTVFSLYRSLKITRNDACALSLDVLASGLVDEKRDRAILKAGAVRGEAPLAAVVAPRVVTGESRLASAHRARVLAGLAPSTLLQSPGVTGRTFEVIARAVRSVPCHELAFGSEWARAAGLVRELLA